MSSPALSTRIRRAGGILISEAATNGERSSALAAFSQFRQELLPMLEAFRRKLEGDLKCLGLTGRVVWRLKNVASTERKLRRSRGLMIPDLHDIAGLRVILPTTDDARRFSEAMKEKFTADGWRFREKTLRDYTRSPKPDGYRSIHRTYHVFRTEEAVLPGKSRLPLDFMLRAELQIRSEAEHAWATGVETIGFLTGHRLKSGEGPEIWKRFLLLSATLFARLEGTMLPESCARIPRDELARDVRLRAHALRIFDLMPQYTVERDRVFAADRLPDGHDLQLIELDLKSRTTALTSFPADDAASAESCCLSQETPHGSLPDPDRFVLLARSGGMKETRETYPAMFLDSSAFRRTLEAAIKRFI
ncbi:hypothetical protein [Sutterella sp.]|uniref:hypothetical protein n=1 Tax=Sutterella sp. TaxID=1981025 RepID=UPI0026E01F18|nr:hypothetical protein [Sutterella sp.]MDO5531222.1 hypothetical protein [Sutterella sp.]